MALEACVVVAPVLDPDNRAWFDTVQLVSFVFEILIWSLVFAVGGTHRSSASIIVSLGLGLFSLGSAVGSVAGVQLGSMTAFMFVNLLFAVALLPTFVMVGERDLDELIAFDSDTSAPDSLGQALGGKIAPKQVRVKGGFSAKLDEYATLHRLTARETETLAIWPPAAATTKSQSPWACRTIPRTHVRNVFSKCGVHGPRNSSTL